MMINLITMALAAAVPLAPSGKWVVEYQKDQCIVSRTFGPADASTMFGIKPSVSMEDGGQTLYFVAPNIGGSGVRRGQAVITLGPSGEEKKFSYFSGVPKGMKVRGYEIHAGADFIAQLAQATVVSIKAGNDELSFATGKVGPVLKALRTCNENLFRTWGVDPTAMAKARTGIDPADWFPPSSYPEDAKRRGATGRSVIVVTVSDKGLPTACRVVISSDASLDAASCRLASRYGRFEPSSDAKDRYAILAVRWELWDV